MLPRHAMTGAVNEKRLHSNALVSGEWARSNGWSLSWNTISYIRDCLHDKGHFAQTLACEFYISAQCGL